jgi:hypothetical protein
LVRGGATVRNTSITSEFTVADFREVNQESVPLFVIKPNQRLVVITSENGDPYRGIGEGDTILSLTA